MCHLLPIAVVNNSVNQSISAASQSRDVTTEFLCFLFGIVGSVAAIWLFRVIRSWRLAGERERTRADKAIREAERRYQSIFENAVEGIFQTSPDGEYLNVNPALARMYGYDSPKSLIIELTDIGQQLYVNSDTRREFKNIMDEHDVVSGFEAEIYRRDGSTIWIREHARAVRDKDGELLYYEGTVQDVTAQRRDKAKITALNQTLELRLKRLAGLRNIDIAISASLDPRLSMNIVLEQAVEQLSVDAAAVWLYDQNSHELTFFCGKGLPVRRYYPSVRVGSGPLGEAALHLNRLSARTLSSDNAIAPHAEAMLRQGFVSYAGTPLVTKGQLRGWLEVYNRSQLTEDMEWADYLDTLAGQAAIAMDSTMMFRDLQRKALELSIAYDSTIEGWSKALGLRDQETGGHSERVTSLTLRIARALDVPEESLVHIRRGALLHDIGKMAVPDAILLKPGPLAQEERDIMNCHPARAYEMLSDISYLRPALDIPYCHHEKWDGTGYPRGLKENQIPLAARIFAVVDVYDALTSDRPYRAGWPEAKAREHIRRLAGSHFDPQVVNIFLLLTSDNIEDEQTSSAEDDLPMAA